jgi:LPPG:FO 2-phospho-L-lactate transferase
VVVSAEGDDGGGDGGQRAIHFQEWWVRHRAELPAERFVVAGLDRATPAPGVLEAIREADVVVLSPSNPVVSIGIILGVPGVRDALRGTRAPVVGVSPLGGGRPVRGPADVCLRTIGVDESSAGVAGLYSDFLDGWLVDEEDPMPDRRGLEVVRRPLLMSSVEAAADMAGAALDLGLRLRAERAPASTGPSRSPRSPAYPRWARATTSRTSSSWASTTRASRSPTATCSSSRARSRARPWVS